MTDSERIVQLEEAVTRLEAAVGDPTKKYAREDPRPTELPNGEYNVLYRQRMLNFAIDELVEDLLPEIRAQIAALEARPSASGSSVPGIFTDELGNVGIGGPPIRDPRNGMASKNYPLTLYGKIAFILNAALNDPQRLGGANPYGFDVGPEADRRDPQRIHGFSYGGDTDGGGPRGTNNGFYFGDGQPGSIPEPWVPDEFRPISTDGRDSRHVWSWQIDKTIPDPKRPGFFIGADDRAQDLTLDLDREYYDDEAGGVVRGIVWGAMKPGRMVWLGSTVKNALDTFFAKWRA